MTNNVTSEIEQEFTDEEFLALAKAFAGAYTDEFLKSIKLVISGNKKYNYSDKPKLDFATLKAIAIITVENFASVNIKRKNRKMDLMEIRRLMIKEDLSKEEAIAIAKSEDYKNIGMAEWAVLQLNQKKLCCDISYFHECISFACGRSVLFHELSDKDSLYAEIINLKKAKTLDEIIDMLPKDKLIVIETEND